MDVPKGSSPHFRGAGYRQRYARWFQEVFKKATHQIALQESDSVLAAASGDTHYITIGQSFEDPETRFGVGSGYGAVSPATLEGEAVNFLWADDQGTEEAEASVDGTDWDGYELRVTLRGVTYALDYDSEGAGATTFVADASNAEGLSTALQAYAGQTVPALVELVDVS